MTENIDIRISEDSPVEERCDALVLFIPEKGSPLESFRAVDRKLKNKLSNLLKEEHFQPRPGESLVYHTNGAMNAQRIIVTGIGTAEKWSEEVFRRAAAAATLAARNAACANVCYTIPEEVKSSKDRLVQALVEGALLSTYRFLKFKTKEEEIQPQKKIQSITLLTEPNSAAKAALQKARLYADATIFARDLVNEPANNLNPEVLAQIARSNVIYVVEENGKLVGSIDIHDLKEFLTEESLYSLVFARDLAVEVGSATPEQSLAEVMDAMYLTDSDQIPVVENITSKKFLGVITRRDVIGAYSREVLKKKMLMAKFVTREKETEGIDYVEMPTGYRIGKVVLKPELEEQTLRETNFRTKYGLQVLEVLRNLRDGKQVRLIAEPGLKLQKGDALIVIGSDEDMNHYRE